MKTVFITIVTTAAAFVLLGGVMIVQEMIFPHSQDYEELWEQVLKQFYQSPLIVTFLIVSVFPGICEELLFRGFLLSGLRPKCPAWAAILIVGILFGTIHVDPYRFLPTTLLGILFGYMVLKTGSIFTGMTAHITNNTIAVLISYGVYKFQNALPAPPSPESISSSQKLLSVIVLIPFGALALVVFILGLRALPRKSDDHISREESLIT